MAISDTELAALKTRCKKALGQGHEIGKADIYAADLAAELGKKDSGSTSADILGLIDQVEAKRAGKPVKVEAPAAPQKAAPPPPPQEPEDGDEDEDEEGSSPVAAPKPKKGSSPTASRPKSPSGSKKKKR